MFKISALSYEILRSKTFNFRSRNSPTVINIFHFTKSPEMIVVVKKKKRNGCFPEGELCVLACQLTAAGFQGGGHHSNLLKHFLILYIELCFSFLFVALKKCTTTPLLVHRSNLYFRTGTVSRDE